MLAIILSLLALAVLVSNLFDNALLRDAQKKLLQQKFESWWKTVEHYDRLQLAVVCVSKTNQFLDNTLGKGLVSKKLVGRCSIISGCLLLITLSWLGLVNNQVFGLTPWKNFKESIAITTTTLDELSNRTNLVTFAQINFDTLHPQSPTNAYVVNINSNLMVFTITTNGIHDIKKIYPVGKGELNVYYHRYFQISTNAESETNSFGHVSVSTDPYKQLSKDMQTLKRSVAKYDTTSYTVLYSVLYFISFFIINAVLFAFSLAICRIMLREIESAKRIISTAALLLVNIITVFSLSCLFLFILTVLAVPIFWFIVPVMSVVSDESLATAIAYLIFGIFFIWIKIGTSAKMIVFIAFLPSVIAAIVGAFTLLAMKWRNAFHFILSFILIRCAEKSPITFLVAIIAFASGILVELAHLLGYWMPFIHA